MVSLQLILGPAQCELSHFSGTPPSNYWLRQGPSEGQGHGSLITKYNGPIINYAKGGEWWGGGGWRLQNGGTVKFTPKKIGGAENVLALLKGGTTVFCVVLM